jgi:hypothetical protein
MSSKAISKQFKRTTNARLSPQPRYALTCRRVFACRARVAVVVDVMMMMMMMMMNSQESFYEIKKLKIEKRVLKKVLKLDEIIITR